MIRNVLKSLVLISVLGLTTSELRANGQTRKFTLDKSKGQDQTKFSSSIHKEVYERILNEARFNEISIDRDLQTGAFLSAVSSTLIVLATYIFLDIQLNVLTTKAPTIAPSKTPTSMPTPGLPEPTSFPSSAPSKPTDMPSIAPSSKPSATPSTLGFILKIFTFVMGLADGFLPGGEVDP